MVNIVSYKVYKMDGLFIQYNKTIGQEMHRLSSSRVESRNLAPQMNPASSVDPANPVDPVRQVDSSGSSESNKRAHNLPNLNIALAASVSSPCLSTPTSQIPQTVLASPCDYSGSIAGVILAAWDNIMGPRVLHVWTPAAPTAVISDFQDGGQKLTDVSGVPCLGGSRERDQFNPGSSSDEQRYKESSTNIGASNMDDSQLDKVESLQQNETFHSVFRSLSDQRDGVLDKSKVEGNKNECEGSMNVKRESRMIGTQKYDRSAVTEQNLDRPEDITYYAAPDSEVNRASAALDCSQFISTSANRPNGNISNNILGAFECSNNEATDCDCSSNICLCSSSEINAKLECNNVIENVKKSDELINGYRFWDKVSLSKDECSNPEIDSVGSGNNSKNLAFSGITSNQEIGGSENLNVYSHNSKPQLPTQQQQQSCGLLADDLNSKQGSTAAQTNSTKYSIRSDALFLPSQQSYKEPETNCQGDSKNRIEMDSKYDNVNETNYIPNNEGSGPQLLSGQQNCDESQSAEADEEFLNADLMKFIATHTLCGEIGRDSDGPCIDVKFHVAPEKSVAMETRIFGAYGSWEGMLGRAAGQGTGRGGGSSMSIHSLSVVFRHDHLPVVLKWKSVCSDWLNRSARLLQVAIHENFEIGCALFCDEFVKLLTAINLITRSSVTRHVQLMDTALHPGHLFEPSFVRKAIVAHLYQSQRSVVIGRSAERVNRMIATLSMFVNDSARYRCVYVDQSAARVTYPSGNHGNSRWSSDRESSVKAVFSPELDVQGFVVNDDVCNVATDLLGGVYDGPAPVALIDVYDCRVWSLCALNVFRERRLHGTVERLQRVFRGLPPDPPYAKEFSCMFEPMDYMERTVSTLMTHLSLLPMTHSLRESYISQYMSHLERQALAIILLVKQKTDRGRKCVPTSHLFSVIRKTFSVEYSCDLMILLAVAERLKPGFVEYIFSNSAS